MIVEFSVQNFRSIKELQTISFVATGLKSSKENILVDGNNIVKKENISLFKTIGLYGANASGKSNIIKALDYFIKAITKEPGSSSHLGLLCDPFLFQKEPEKTESFFQIVLIINNKKYRYGLTVKKNLHPMPDEPNEPYSDEIITHEWLFGPKEKKTVKLFNRKNKDVVNNLPNKDSIPPIPYDHSLFISHVAAFDQNSICQNIRGYFKGLTTSSINNNHEKYRRISINYISHKEQIEEENVFKFLNFLSSFNLSYKEAILEKKPDKELVYPQEKISFKKLVKTSNTLFERELNLYKNESSGTQKLFDLAGLLLRAFRLPIPAFIILDEIDSNFHPFLVIKLIELFNNPKINKSNSQLLFTSHDTNLMSPKIMRRDQFYFTEKKEDESTRLYSLSDLKGIRNDADFAKQYLAGYYGAIPVLNDFIEE